MRVNPETLENKRYLGDGVYAGFDGFQIWLYVQQGDAIAIECPVMNALVMYAKSIWESTAALTADKQSDA